MDVFLRHGVYIFIFLYRKSTQGDNFTHTPTTRPLSDSHQFWHVGSGGGRNQPCQLLSKSVQGLCPRRGRNLPYSIDLMYRPYNSVSTNVLQCDCSTPWGRMRRIFHHFGILFHLMSCYGEKICFSTPRLNFSTFSGYSVL